MSKRFGDVVALDEVSLELRAGEVHAVLGENGAGKSTLVGVLGGFVRPDSGSVTTSDGEPISGDPVAARRAGVQTVHQHFMLVPAFTVAENLALGTLDGLGGRLDLVQSGQRAAQRALDWGWSLDPQTRTGSLSVGARQRIELLKALSHEAKILVLDEPTAVLSENEVEDLLQLLRTLRDDGVALVLIAHKLSEVTAVADRVTVLRHGRVAGSAAMADADSDLLSEWMVGGRVESPTRSSRNFGRTVLKVEDLRVRGDEGQDSVRGVSFEVRQGEILGLGGVDGNGQVELAEALAGIRRAESGRLDRPDDDGRRIGYVPQDRQTDGLAPNLSVMDNMMVGALDDRRGRRGPFLDLSWHRKKARELMAAYDVRAVSERAPVSSLSGGNRQKVLLARVLSADPGVLIVVNPSRGLDIRASAFVHEKILEAVGRGAGVVLISTDADELTTLADLTLYLGRGRLFGSMREATE